MNSPRRSMLLAGFLTAFATGLWLITLLPFPWSLVVVVAWVSLATWLGQVGWVALTSEIGATKEEPGEPIVASSPSMEEVVIQDAPVPADPFPAPLERAPESEDTSIVALRQQLKDLLSSLEAEWARPDVLGPGFEEMLGNEAFIRENVLRSFEIADNLSGSAERAFSLSERVQKGVAVVTDALLESRKQTEILAGHSERITNILGSMAEVSDKIHVLSINASIVSARAGIAGRGFEVVAKEIRALAKESETSLGGIVEVIDLLRSSIEKVNKVVHDADAETEHEKNSLIEVAGSLQGVSLGVEIVKAVSTFAKDKAEEQERLVRRLASSQRGPSEQTQTIVAALKAQLSQSES